MNFEANTRIFELPPNAAIRWTKKFFDEAEVKSEIVGFAAFLERDGDAEKAALAESGVPSNSAEFRRVDQILYHVRDQAWHRNQQLLKIAGANVRVRQRLSESRG